MKEVIELLPGELQARVQSDSFFCDIPVVVADEGNVLATMNKLQAALTTKNGKRGVAVVVLQVIGDYEDSEVTFGPMRLRPAFQVIENRELNLDPRGTGKSARLVARKLVDVITSMRLQGLCSDFVPDKPCIEPVNLRKELGAGIVAYHVNFWTVEADTTVRDQVIEPAISLNGGNFEIVCGTDVAVIWYTTDGSYPVPTSVSPTSTAKVYADPVALAAGATTIVRAAAFKAGLMGSGVAWAEFTES